MKPEPLFICPVCGTAGFTANGLHRHQCKAKPDRARLTLVEISQAQLIPTTSPVPVKGGA